MKSTPIRSYNKSHLAELLGPVETQYQQVPGPEVPGPVETKVIEMQCVALEDYAGWNPNLIGYQVENVTSDATYIVDVSTSLPSAGRLGFVGESKSGCMSVSVKQGLVEIASFEVSTTKISKIMWLDQVVDDATVTVRISPGCSGGDNFGDLSFAIYCTTYTD